MDFVTSVTSLPDSGLTPGSMRYATRHQDVYWFELSRKPARSEIAGNFFTEYPPLVQNSLKIEPPNATGSGNS
jgi:hypothetical protein